MKIRRLISWLGKKRLFTLRHAVFYCIVLCFFFSFHYWNGEAFASTENDAVSYLDGDSSYFYLRDSDLKIVDTGDISASGVSIQSAYYDNRASAADRSLVRVFATVYSSTNSAFCCFQASAHQTWICSKYLAKQKVLPSSDFSRRSSGWYKVAQVMFSCAVDERDLSGVRLERILLVSVRNEVATRLSKSHEISYAISQGLRLTNSTSFTVCVLPSARTPSRRFSTSQDLFEYFELLKLLGTSEVISYYEDDDIATVLRKVKGLTQETVGRRTNITDWLSLVINDCLYRSLANADYVLFLDVNEVLIPNTTRDWSAMLASLQRVHNTNKVGAYVLQVFDFFDQTTNNTSSDTATSNFETKRANKRTISHLKHLPRVVRFRARGSKTAPEKTILGQPTKIDHITGSGSIKMLPGYINVNVPVDYASVHRFIHDRHVYKGLTIDATKDKFVPLLMRRLYSLGNIVR